jgi:hypothetical protein
MPKPFARPGPVNLLPRSVIAGEPGTLGSGILSAGSGVHGLPGVMWLSYGGEVGVPGADAAELAGFFAAIA